MELSIPDTKEVEVSSIKDSRDKSVCWAILVRDGALFLPQYLKCLIAQDYDKELIHLYIHTNNNSDTTEQILDQFVEEFGSLFSGVTFLKKLDDPDSNKRSWHEWPLERLKVMARIRQESIKFAQKNNFDYYFVSDVDNFISSKVLTESVKLHLPVVAPYLRTPPGDPIYRYSNFHEQIGPIGEFVQSERNLQICSRELVGIIPVDLVHCTYLVRGDILPFINYQLFEDNYEYRNFALSLKRNAPHVQQYLDARHVWGYLMHTDFEGALKSCQESLTSIENLVKNFNEEDIEKDLFQAVEQSKSIKSNHV